MDFGLKEDGCEKYMNKHCTSGPFNSFPDWWACPLWRHQSKCLLLFIQTTPIIFNAGFLLQNSNLILLCRKSEWAMLVSYMYALSSWTFHLFNVKETAVQMRAAFEPFRLGIVYLRNSIPFRFFPVPLGPAGPKQMTCCTYTSHTSSPGKGYWSFGLSADTNRYTDQPSTLDSFIDLCFSIAKRRDLCSCFFLLQLLEFLLLAVPWTFMYWRLVVLQLRSVANVKRSG